MTCLATVSRGFSCQAYSVESQRHDAISGLVSAPLTLFTFHFLGPSGSTTAVTLRQKLNIVILTK